MQTGDWRIPKCSWSARDIQFESWIEGEVPLSSRAQVREIVRSELTRSVLPLDADKVLVIVQAIQARLGGARARLT